MGYVVPNFPSLCSVWRRSNWITTWPPTVPGADLTGVPCQLRGPGHSNLPLLWFGVDCQQETVLLPPGTDVRMPDLQTSAWPRWPDMIEVPESSGRYYMIVGVADVAKDFPNEYRTALILPTSILEGAYWASYGLHPWAPPWPTPYP